MPTIARHHAEWLSLLEISGPFLSMPVLLDAFPNGLDSLDSERTHNLRAAYEEWADNQGGLKPDPAIHSAWVRYVLAQALEYDGQILLEGQAVPAGIKATFPEHAQTLRPDLVLVEPRTQKPRLLIQVFPTAQELDKPIPGSRWSAAVSTRMMELLHATHTRLGLITNGEHWMLVDAPVGETSGFISWYAPLWFEEPLTLRAFASLLGKQRFMGVPDAETIEALLAKSAQDQQEVTDQLGYQVRSAVEILIRALDKADQDRGRQLLADLPPYLLYEAALTVMMRLVFLMSAEERKLLPLDDPFYAQNYAISTLRAQLREGADQTGEEVLERRYDAWCRLLAAFRAVYGGLNHDRLKLLAYGGSLFDPDRFPFLEGRPAGTRWLSIPAAPLPVDNRTVLHLLEALQILRVKVPGGGPAEARRLSFRALDIEQIGHVYEGLLDHVAVRAGETILGLNGAKDKEPEIALARLAALRTNPAALLDFLHEETGRSKPAMEKALRSQPDAWQANRLLSACGNDETLFTRVLPFAGLVRGDDSGGLVIIPGGSLYVTQGSTRRATGTHYTPRSLTEPVVQHTLEPLVYYGPAEGLPRAQWRLRSPWELLALKICDMAMGSGAFLVQVCRYLAERLVEAWGETLRAMAESSGRRLVDVWITNEGLTTDNADQAIPPGDADRLVLARRLVADRCLYGVDKNPLAVEMAKLSLWLVTLDKNRAFTFLDHALKCGDSLVGASADEFLRWANRKKSAAMSLDQEVLREELEKARRLRKELESFVVRDVQDAVRKEALLQEAEAAMEHIKRGADLLTGIRLIGLKAQEVEEIKVWMTDPYIAGEFDVEIDRQKYPNAVRALSAAKMEKAFHWDFEFPEVFEKGGFSAFVGNPPFLWGNRISSRLGDNYRDWLSFLHPSSFGNADLCAHFFLRANTLVCLGGSVGLISTNSISETDNRISCLEPILSSGSTITGANPDFQWPGDASIRISIVVWFKGLYMGRRYLDEQEVDNISSFLDSTSVENEPKPLFSNSGSSFKGVDTGGLGFVVTDEEKNSLCDADKQAEKYIWPFINGSDLLSHPEQKASRIILNLSNMKLDEVKQCGPVYKFLLERVKPYRDTVKRDRNKVNWWLYNEPRPGLYKSISTLSKVLTNCVVSKYICFDFLPVRMVFSNALNIFINDSFEWFSILQSSVHEFWARYYASTLRTHTRYNPTDCFETFPFPEKYNQLKKIGEIYYNYRCKIMTANQEGLTNTYNRFNNPNDLSEKMSDFRKLHIELDYAVITAYGWTGLNLDHNFYSVRASGGTIQYTISESARREVLSRLLKLNHERYEEEIKAGLHDNKKGTTQPKPARPEAKSPRKHSIKEQPNLLYEVEPVIEPEVSPAAAEVQPVPAATGEIGSWDQCVCLGCGKHLVGFSVAEHTQSVHRGMDPGYRKVKR